MQLLCVWDILTYVPIDSRVLTAVNTYGSGSAANPKSAPHALTASKLYPKHDKPAGKSMGKTGKERSLSKVNVGTSRVNEGVHMDDPTPVKRRKRYAPAS